MSDSKDKRLRGGMTHSSAHPIDPRAGVMEYRLAKRLAGANCSCPAPPDRAIPTGRARRPPSIWEEEMSTLSSSESRAYAAGWLKAHPFTVVGVVLLLA